MEKGPENVSVVLNKNDVINVVSQDHNTEKYILRTTTINPIREKQV